MEHIRAHTATWVDPPPSAPPSIHYEVVGARHHSGGVCCAHEPPRAPPLFPLQVDLLIEYLVANPLKHLWRWVQLRMSRRRAATFKCAGGRGLRGVYHEV